MYHPVNPIEMKFTPIGNKNEPTNRPYWITPKISIP
jgi:hypothetical protein